MPLYEFYCPQCRKKFEELCRTALDSLPCPQCAAESKKVLSAFRAGKSSLGESIAASDGCGG
ncbi:MAG: zinc ribbon domain-containing protein [Dethiobacteria bacterium]|nr:zinc ribbon domain-containing protein [Bacillota bacterium]NMD32588.1 zinc ribbon domain-containing protein [Bacillota bacterium]HOB28782.1 zinc ribbon domain-containing protein [Bacillota bacterium]HPZ41734.1 zinc ribbon domain-containing protein [Bacillota bacterium]HQD52541.1 zinc ribbon domain-containing protein [Bacillota bacterium]